MLRPGARGDKRGSNRDHEIIMSCTMFLTGIGQLTTPLHFAHLHRLQHRLQDNVRRVAGV